MMVRIYWRSRLTGKDGHGEPLSRDLAEAWIDLLAKLHHDLDHWIEDCP